jgi:hypothetical protein
MSTQRFKLWQEADDLFHKSGIPFVIANFEIASNFELVPSTSTLKDRDKIKIRFPEVVSLANALDAIPEERHTVKDPLFVESIASMHLLLQNPAAFDNKTVDLKSASIYFNFLADASAWANANGIKL